MKAHSYSLRGLVASSAIATIALGSACSAPPPGSEAIGQTSEPLLISSGSRGTIGTRTGAPTPDGAACPNYHVPVPTSLQGYDCTEGVEIDDDPNMAGLPYAVDSNGVPAQAIAWACSTRLTLGALATAAAGNFGGPSVQPLFLNQPLFQFVGLAESTEDDCLGPPDPGYEIVMEVFSFQMMKPIVEPLTCEGALCLPTLVPAPPSSLLF